MSKGSAIVAVLIAFVGGLAIGHLTGRSSGVSDEVAGEILDDSVERYKVPVTDKQPMKGEKEEALVTIVESSDFQCPFCSRVLPTVEKVLDEYKGKVRVVWMNNPLPFHKDAGPAAQAALEAFDQGGDEKFWKMHDVLFKNQKALSRADLERYAKQIGLNTGKFKKALDSGKHSAAVRADQQLVQGLGARGTPAFFINGRKLVGAQPFENFKEMIDEEIERAEKLVDAGVSKDELYAAFIKDGLTEEAKAPAAQPPQARKTPDPKAVYKVPVTGKEAQRGPKDALVTIVEFSDFECPFCGRVEPTVDSIVKKYGKDVRVVWMNNPLPFHKNAMPAAQAAMEAFAQGGSAKFWKMHALLFENQRALARENLDKYATQVGLNAAKFKKALDSDAHKETILAQQKLARSLGANGTPSFFINGRNLRGAQPLPAFEAVIDEELAKAKELVKKGTPRAKVYAETIKNGATAPKFIDGPAGAAAAKGGAPSPDKEYKIPVPSNSPFKGGAKAKVVIQEFSDFQCPFCSRVGPTIKQIEKEYGSKVKIVWRHFPLPFHQKAMPAHEASMEVFKQGGSKKFWAYHDLLFKNQSALDRADLEKYAGQVGGINIAQFKKALDDHRHKKAIEADMAAVTKAGARIGTPSFFVNGKLVQGAQPFAKFKEVIDAELKG